MATLKTPKEPMSHAINKAEEAILESIAKGRIQKETKLCENLALCEGNIKGLTNTFVFSCLTIPCMIDYLDKIDKMVKVKLFLEAQIETMTKQFMK